MTTLCFFHPDGSVRGHVLTDHEAQARLQALGIETGRWALKQRPVSNTPQLTYARELHALQQRFGSLRVDRLSWPVRGPRLAGTLSEPEVPELHVHDDLEVRVVLAGHARFVVAAAPGDGWLLIDCAPGEWIVLPQGLPHALSPVKDATLDLLRLFARPGGWVAHRTGAGRPPPLEAPQPQALAA